MKTDRPLPESIKPPEVFTPSEGLQQALSELSIDLMIKEGLAISPQNRQKALIAVITPIRSRLETGTLPGNEKAIYQIAREAVVERQKIRSQGTAIFKEVRKDVKPSFSDLAIPQNFVQEAQRQLASDLPPNLKDVERLTKLYQRRLTDIPQLAQLIMDRVGIELEDKNFKILSSMIRGFSVGSLLRYLNFKGGLNPPTLTPEALSFLGDFTQKSGIDINAFSNQLAVVLISEDGLIEVSSQIFKTFLDEAIERIKFWQSHTRQKGMSLSDPMLWKKTAEYFHDFPIGAVFSRGVFTFNPEAIALAREQGRPHLWLNAVRVGNDIAVPSPADLVSAAKILQMAETPENRSLREKIKSAQAAWEEYTRRRRIPTQITRIEEKLKKLEKEIDKGMNSSLGETDHHRIQTTISMLSGRVAALTREISSYDRALERARKKSRRLKSVAGILESPGLSYYRLQELRDEIKKDLKRIGERKDETIFFLTLPHVIHLNPWQNEQKPTLSIDIIKLNLFLTGVEELLVKLEGDSRKDELPPPYNKLSAPELDRFLGWIEHSTANMKGVRFGKNPDQINKARSLLKIPSHLRMGSATLRKIFHGEISSWRNRLIYLVGLLQEEEESQSDLTTINDCAKQIARRVPHPSQGEEILDQVIKDRLEYMRRSLEVCFLPKEEAKRIKSFQGDLEKARQLAISELTLHRAGSIRFYIPPIEKAQEAIQAEIAKRRNAEYPDTNVIQILTMLAEFVKKKNVFVPFDVGQGLFFKTFLNGVNERVALGRALTGYDDAASERTKAKQKLEQAKKRSKTLEAQTQIQGLLALMTRKRSEYESADKDLILTMQRLGLLANKGQLGDQWRKLITL